MNEMYSMGLSLHSIGAVAIMVMIIVNLFIVISFTDLKKYKRVNSIVLIPLTFSTLGVVLFTGVIMMAAKHLHFTLENIVMIFIGVFYIYLEVKRLKALKYLDMRKEHAFAAYKPFARTIFQIEFALVLVISVWMWLI